MKEKHTTRPAVHSVIVDGAAVKVAVVVEVRSACVLVAVIVLVVIVADYE